MIPLPDDPPHCPARIRLSLGIDVDCELEPDHLEEALYHEGGFTWSPTRVMWLTGDRREFVGEWPGPCPAPGCGLPRGHHGRCAP